MFGATIYGAIYHGDDCLDNFGVNTLGSNQYGQIHLDPRKRIHVKPPPIIDVDSGYGGGMPMLLVGGQDPEKLRRDRIRRDDEDVLTALLSTLSVKRRKVLVEK